MENLKKDIRRLSKKELQEFFVSKNLPKYKGSQVYEWIWKKGSHDFDLMTNLSFKHRTLLKDNFEIRHVNIDFHKRSLDGTIKNAVKLYDNLIVESVLIPKAKRITACISSQVGCSLDCTFCATSSLKRIRNLNPDEIYDQVILMSQQSKYYFNRPLSNIVFMGMGEPLLNYNNVLIAIRKINEPEGLGISSRRITLSTSGIPKMIKKMADENVKFRLAVSLHSARQSLREKIMPFAKKFPLEELLDSLQHWYLKTRKKVTFEYVIWEGINDKKADINALVNFCKMIPSKVNLIQYNPIENSSMKEASEESINLYVHALNDAKIKVTYRRSRGQDIDAACGQLANKLDLA